MYAKQHQQTEDDERDDNGWMDWEEDYRKLMLTSYEQPATHPVYKFMDKVSKPKTKIEIT
jgi:hypothetical protein